MASCLFCGHLQADLLFSISLARLISCLVPRVLCIDMDVCAATLLIAVCANAPIVSILLTQTHTYTHDQLVTLVYPLRHIADVGPDYLVHSLRAGLSAAFSLPLVDGDNLIINLHSRDFILTQAKGSGSQTSRTGRPRRIARLRRNVCPFSRSISAVLSICVSINSTLCPMQPTLVIQ